jgi:hypothetical protein
MASPTTPASKVKYAPIETGGVGISSSGDDEGSGSRPTGGGGTCGQMAPMVTLVGAGEPRARYPSGTQTLSLLHSNNQRQSTDTLLVPPLHAPDRCPNCSNTYERAPLH